MDNAQWKAVTGEFEIESAYVVHPDKPTEMALVRVFKDKGGLIRIDLSPMEGDDVRLQIVMGRKQLMRRLDDPQDPLPQAP